MERNGIGWPFLFTAVFCAGIVLGMAQAHYSDSQAIVVLMEDNRQLREADVVLKAADAQLKQADDVLKSAQDNLRGSLQRVCRLNGWLAESLP